MCLKAVSSKVKKGINEGSAKLLLSSPKYYDLLLENLESQGIKQCYDGIEFIAGKINHYFKREYDCSNIVAVHLSGFSVEQKHLGNIIHYLKSAGLHIVYIFSLKHYWVKDIVKTMEARQELFVCADCEMLESLDFFPFIIEQGNVMKFHKNVKNLKIVTSMEQIPNQVCSSRESLEFLNMAFFMSSYVNIHSDSLYKVIAKLQEFGGNVEPTLKFVKGGYPSIEKEVVAFEEFSKDVVSRDTVIFISCFLNFEFPEKLERFIAATLERGWRVIFKACPPLLGLGVETQEREDNFIKSFLKYDNFVYWDNSKARLNVEDLERSITMVELYSSMMYSYPVITMRPAILLYPDENEILKDVLENDSFYNENLHIRIFGNDINGFLATLESLTKDSVKIEWKNRINHYRFMDLYNFKNSSEYIANWIINWYNKRKLLIKE
ncbi:hypothetical protein [Helicobacter sp.]|nr:hypothetical protein [Helicobacter sp.]MCI5968903.1 hypothetical protein [Helicobacter sp.]